MATTDMRDIRFDRIDQEYLSLRSTQDKLITSLDQVLPTMAKGIQENRELILENRTMIQENRSMLLAIIKHLEVPYQPKRPMGFNIDPRPKD